MAALAAIQTTKAVKHVSIFGESSYRGQDVNIHQDVLQRWGKSKVKQSE